MAEGLFDQSEYEESSEKLHKPLSATFSAAKRPHCLNRPASALVNVSVLGLLPTLIDQLSSNTRSRPCYFLVEYSEQFAQDGSETLIDGEVTLLTYNLLSRSCAWPYLYTCSG